MPSPVPARSRSAASAAIALCGLTLSMVAAFLLESAPAAGQAAVPGSSPVGTVIAYAGVTTPTGWLVADGQAVSRIQYAELFATIGTTYGAGDGVTTFNLPDLRGRVPVGADGLAGRLSGNDLMGQSGGEEKHTLTLAESPSHAHADGTLTASTVGDHAHGDGTLATNSVGDHAHGDGTLSTSTAGAHSHALYGYSVSSIDLVPDNGNWVLNYNRPYGMPGGALDPAGAHAHDVAGTTSGAGAHGHDVTGSTGSAGTHGHDIAGSTSVAGGGSAHNVMQPYQVLSYLIRATSA